MGKVVRSKHAKARILISYPLWRSGISCVWFILFSGMVLPYQLSMIGHIKVGDFQFVSNIAKLRLVLGKELFLHTDAVVAFCLSQLFNAVAYVLSVR